MRRTYRSKKETGGAIDHKDVIHALDEKSSAFDAFYIQNIKQTKRELSCIGPSSHYGVAANKVRKRKYVKRILKDPEPTVSISPLQSGFLTPDKSIRVNKGQDLFDQLLNSSTPRQNGSPKESRFKIGRFPARQESKTYTRKFAKVKKYNCSSSDSVDSDKENSNDDCELQNVTDLRSYNLVIERERKPTTKYLDESINKIVKNISALNSINFHRDTSIGSAKKSLSNVRHRLTSHIQSPLNSPLCSTPFKEKYRSQSIYKFSPISFGKNDVTTECLTIIEDDGNESVVFVDKECEPLQKSTSDDMAPSPIIHLSKNINLKTEVFKDNCPISVTEAVTPKLSETKTDELHSKSVEISDFQTTEAEPFLGFSNNKLHENQYNCNKDETKSMINEPKSDNVKNSNIILENISCNVINSTDNSLLSDPEEVEEENDSSYDTCNSEQSSLHNSEVIKIPVVKIEKLNNSVLEKYLDKLSACKSNHSVNHSDDYASLESSDSPMCEDDSQNDLSEESEYEMPSVEKSSNDESEIEDIESDDSDSNKNREVERCDIESDERDSTRHSEEERYEVESDERDSNRNSEEERCISFVTTRKRNEVINDSLIFGFNNSFGSGSSTDCDKTVLSNNNEKTKIQPSLSPNICVTPGENVNTEVLNVSAENDDLKEPEKENCADTTRISSITTRKVSKLHTESNISISKSIMDEGKPGIVLQPGKKWERSLSIYRRMTMMTDHFDQSILDDDEFDNKGRKFRQSVISTMELQDKSSLHNESIISRRSTFVSKPCRSTIRIIKEPNTSRLSLCTTAVSEDLVGFLNEDCDDTIVELSKLSIADSAHEVTVIENIHDTSNRVSTARDYVLRRCGQSDAIPFDECYPEALLKNCRKIGEGVYGEVFLWRARDGRARVMKIVPIAGTTKVNGEHQKDFQEIISEIVIAMELSALRAPINEIQREFDEGKSIDSLDLHSVENATDVFNEVLAVRCVYGAYPSRLLDLWELYDECNGSENDNPAVLPVDQQYIVLELANAGQDLESYEFNSAEQAHALFLQVAFGLAVAEEAFQFEHRDLHWGNVLIAPTDQKFATFVLRGRAHRVARCGVAGTVIDYSLSRLSLPLPAAGDAAALYNDLAHDDGLFDAVGDYQFQVYRLMREKLGNDWKNFEPYTNILWLHYTVDKMITALRYKRTNTKIHKHYIAKLKGIKNRILDYGSAAQFVLTDNEF